LATSASGSAGAQQRARDVVLEGYDPPYGG